MGVSRGNTTAASASTLRLFASASGPSSSATAVAWTLLGCRERWRRRRTNLGEATAQEGGECGEEDGGVAQMHQRRPKRQHLRHDGIAGIGEQGCQGRPERRAVLGGEVAGRANQASHVVHCGDAHRRVSMLKLAKGGTGAP